MYCFYIYIYIDLCGKVTNYTTDREFYKMKGFLMFTVHLTLLG